MRSRKLASGIALVVGAAIMLTGPAAASADTYAPDPNAQVFQNSGAGWTATAEYSGLCIPLVTCPSVSGGFVNSGGTGGPGDGYIAASVIGLLSTEAATSSEVLESPAFTYNGNQGHAPATVTFDIARLPELDALLGVDVLNDATFKADLVDQSNGGVINVLPAVHDPDNDGVWAALPTQSVNPNLLVLGHQYKIRITTTYHTTAVLIPNGSIGYDNVVLTTAGTGTGPGGNGGPGDNIYGDGIYSSSQLNQLVLTQGLPSVGTLRGNILTLRVKCPRQAAPNPCKYTIQGLSKGRKSKPATKRAKARIKAGGAKLVKVKVKPKFLAKYQAARKVTIRAKVKVGKVSTTAYKKVRVVKK